MACRLNSAKPVSNPVLKLWSLFKTFNFHLAIYIRKCRLLWNASHYASEPRQKLGIYIYIRLNVYIKQGGGGGGGGAVWRLLGTTGQHIFAFGMCARFTRDFMAHSRQQLHVGYLSAVIHDEVNTKHGKVDNFLANNTLWELLNKSAIVSPYV